MQSQQEQERLYREYVAPIEPLIETINEELGTRIRLEPFYGLPQQCADALYVSYKLRDQGETSKIRVLVINVDEPQYEVRSAVRAFSVTSASKIKREMRTFWSAGNPDSERIAYVPQRP